MHNSECPCKINTCLCDSTFPDKYGNFQKAQLLVLLCYLIWRFYIVFLLWLTFLSSYHLPNRIIWAKNIRLVMLTHLLSTVCRYFIPLCHHVKDEQKRSDLCHDLSGKKPCVSSTFSFIYIYIYLQPFSHCVCLLFSYVLDPTVRLSQRMNFIPTLLFTPALQLLSVQRGVLETFV